jgi:hypothetical protein
MSRRTASCSCGNFTVTAEGEPIRISICHCLECQKRTGSTFGMQARFANENVSLHGESREFQRVGDEGSHISFHFCPSCGSTVCWTNDGVRGFTAVAVGAFADSSFPPPTVSVYESRRHAWVGLPEQIKHLD